MTETTYTRNQVNLALGTMHGQLDEVTDTSIVGYLTAGTLHRIGKGPFTREQVTKAINAEANELDPQGKPGVFETSDTIRTQDVINLAVSTALHLLDHPHASLEQAIAAEYEHSGIEPDFDDLPGDAPEPEEGSPEFLAGIVKVVKSWVA